MELELTAGPAPHGEEPEIKKTFAMLRAHVTDGGTAAIVVAGVGTAQRVCERLADAEVPSGLAEAGAAPEPGRVSVFTALSAAGHVPGGAAGDRHRNRPHRNAVAGVRDGRKLPASAATRLIRWP